MQPDADGSRRAFVSRLGIGLEKTYGLEEQLLEALRVDIGGFAFLGDLPLLSRAVVSDQLVGASRAVTVNLVEARLHEMSLGALGEGGFGFPTSPEDHERAMRFDAERVAFFRAIGSALDCLAAVLIGLLRIPASIRRASFAAILRLEPEAAETETQKRVWTELRRLVDREANEPTDWLAWTLQMRHALMHRARVLDILVARETELPAIALPAHVVREVAAERVRADHHLRRKPWLPDMQHLADSQAGITDAILTESDAVTVRGIMVATNRLVECCSGWLHDCWDTLQEGWPSPSKAWRFERPPPIAFDGFAPDQPLPALSAMMVSPRDGERIRIAIAVRDSIQQDLPPA